MRSEIQFLRRGKTVKLAGISPSLTLLDYLRLTERATGTKEGCVAAGVVLRTWVGSPPPRSEWHAGVGSGESTWI